MKKFIRLITNKKVLFGIIMVALGIIVTRSFDKFIILNFPNRPLPDDLLFRLIPQNDFVGYVFDTLSSVGVLLMVGYYYLKFPNKLPKFLVTISAIYIVRSFIMILTPLANSSGLGVNTGIMGLLQQNFSNGISPYSAGMFPSGHTALATFMYLAVDKSHKNLKLLILAFLFCEVFSAIASRSHYSIDIVGGLMLSLILVPYMDRFDKYLLLKEHELDR